MKRLLKGVQTGRPVEVQTALLRRHLLELTQSFMIPLERYVASLMPLQKNICPYKVRRLMVSTWFIEMAFSPSYLNYSLISFISCTVNCFFPELAPPSDITFIFRQYQVYVRLTLTTFWQHWNCMDHSSQVESEETGRACTAGFSDQLTSQFGSMLGTRRCQTSCQHFTCRPFVML